MMSKATLTNYLYNLFPEFYRVEDANNDFVLKKLIMTIVDGGFSYILSKIKSFTDINDPEKCPDEILPYLLESNGITYQNSIDIKYQRKIAKYLGELNRRRGTYSSVRYLVRVLTGLNAELRDEKLEEEGKIIKNLYIVLKATSLEQIDNMENHVSIVENYIQSQIPYNITPIIRAEIETQVLRSHQYSAGAISSSVFYRLAPSQT